MSDHPIIFSAPMVRALLDGRKSMTRRLAKGPACKSLACYARNPIYGRPHYHASAWQRVRPGDRLWVRETPVPSSTGFEYDTPDDDCIDLSDLNSEQIEFWNKRAGDDPNDSRRVSPIHMPRWASRLTLIVTATKIERLQSISPEDAVAEGLKKLSKDAAGQEARGFSPTWKYGLPEPDGLPGPQGWQWHEWRISPIDAFQKLWESLHGDGSWDEGSWDENPEVVAITFRVIKANIDAPEARAA